MSGDPIVSEATPAAPAVAGYADLEAGFRAFVDRLRSNVVELRTAFSSATPYPHLVIDGAFEPILLDRIVAEFPGPDQRADWHVWKTLHEDKTTSRGLSGLAPFTQLFHWLLCSNEVIDAVSAITGIDDLVPDPLFHGAGLMESGRGGWLGLHSDYIAHRRLSLWRRLNLLVYLNRDWDPAWGGELELWGRNAATAGAAYAPLFNRLVILPTTPATLHGHPTPNACPEGRHRRLLSVYYWTTEPPHAPPGSGMLQCVLTRAHRVLHRMGRRLQWRGPKFAARRHPTAG